MAQVAGTTDTFDIVGIAESVSNVISDISPTDTPLHSMSGRSKAVATLHQWQTDELAAAAENRQIEGDEATFATAAPTVMLSNYTQIGSKTCIVSRTADGVRKYGRARETARLLVKNGKELKRDMEYQHARNQPSLVGSSTVARSAASMETMISAATSFHGTGGSTPGYAAGLWAAPVDGTQRAFTEDMLKDALQASWENGGETSWIMLGPWQKRTMASFVGTTKFAGNYVSQGRSTQGVIVAGVDLYISDYGEHKTILNRFQRDRTVLLLDSAHVNVAWMDRPKPVQLAKTGDATKYMLVEEHSFEVDNPKAHAKISDLLTA